MDTATQPVFRIRIEAHAKAPESYYVCTNDPRGFRIIFAQRLTEANARRLATVLHQLSHELRGALVAQILKGTSL